MWCVLWCVLWCVFGCQLGRLLSEARSSSRQVQVAIFRYMLLYLGTGCRLLYLGPLLPLSRDSGCNGCGFSEEGGSADATVRAMAVVLMHMSVVGVASVVAGWCMCSTCSGLQHLTRSDSSSGESQESKIEVKVSKN